MQASKVERCEIIVGNSTSCHGIFYFQFLSAGFFFGKYDDFKVVMVELIPQNNWL